MKEDFLHYIWKYKLFDQNDLKTTCGLPVTIKSAGEHNFHSGPDFHAARIRIDETEWAGNLEIHVKASEWHQHGHQRDPAYDNVILHVVYEDDKPVQTTNGRHIPAMELKGRIFTDAVLQYDKLQGKTAWIPCEKSVQDVDAAVWPLWLDELLIRRLNRKSTEILAHYHRLKGDWNSCFYHLLVERFGLRVNNAAFRLLAASIPYQLLFRKEDDPEMIEAILLGQSGLLHDHHTEAYPQKLWMHYKHIRHAHQLEPLPPSIWKKARMRPTNFPAVRIAQLAQLIAKSKGLFARLLEATDLQDLQKEFRVQASVYWNNHYVIDKPADHKPKAIGAATIANLTINVLIPVLYAHATFLNDAALKERAITFMKQLPAEKNQIIKKWQALNVVPRHAGDTQALHELKNYFCSPKKCLNCSIADQILTP